MTENVYEKLVNRQASLSLVGLGYVGMPIIELNASGTTYWRL